MSEFDPERFEEEKYRDHLTQLQQAYKAAFGRMREDLGYDSTLVHAVDQFVLNESEPFWDDERETFRVDVPAEPTPAQRVESAGVVVDESKLDAMLADYRETLAEELEVQFGLREPPEENA
ncbi:DUF5783 family protein [Salinirubellus salinus]|uniref:DUF5783 family protein n=1 Tax=Salinirubellus salinus TaxID=1364945 RepID=A0A9E7UAR2_9EURY|nr:DUF5783 family protein [Salinirubellus salinus]UWM54064.1 DUF5783 family protein [Salinirubellus salinus]